MDFRRRNLLDASVYSDSGTTNEGPININNYLTIEALVDGLTASLSVNACEYCVDGDGNWKSLAAETATESINTGQTLSFRGNLKPSGLYGIGIFTISKKCNLKGNCMSMLFGDNAANNYSLSGKSYAFYCLFRSCSNIVTVSKNFLPATTLANSCYSRIFEYCTGLTTAPDLPATTLAERCYESAFSGCTKLTTTPVLPATTLAYYCYVCMFIDCTSMKNAPALPATTLAENCYGHMFEGCTRLTTAPVLPATTLAYHCYGHMFRGCTGLTDAPVLHVTTLASSCYFCMFYGCTKLNYIKMLATDISASSCLGSWVYNVATTGTFIKNPAMNSLPTGTDGIPSGWTVLNDGEENSIFPMYLNTTYDSSRGLYYRDEDDLSRSLWEWIEQNREKDPDGMKNEDYIPYSIMSQCELYIDDVKVEYLFTDGPGSDNYWNWYPMNSKYNTGAFEPIRILEGGRIEIWED